MYIHIYSYIIPVSCGSSGGWRGGNQFSTIYLHTKILCPWKYWLYLKNWTPPPLEILPGSVPASHDNKCIHFYIYHHYRCRSSNDYRYRCLLLLLSEHRQSWHIFTIFMEVMTSELLLIYIRNTTESSPPSALRFDQWYLGVRNPNYKLMAEVVFTFCLALHVFRAGVR